MARLAERGGSPSQSPKALAAECDLVMTCLPTSNEVRDAIFGADGIASGLKRGGIIADMTTGDPNATRAMATELASRGISLIDAPVSGGPHGADAGTIAIMVGAPADIYARVQPVFETISPNVFHCGDVGAGHTMKLVNNVIAASVRVATFEAVTMGIRNGLTLEACARVLAKGSARSYTTEITLPKFVRGELKTNFFARADAQGCAAGNRARSCKRIADAGLQPGARDLPDCRQRPGGRRGRQHADPPQ
jgi:3-hydroxyisobutyrate dehydrogenase